MLDEILDLFERDRKKSGAPKQGGMRGLLNRFSGDDDDRRGSNDQQRRYDDDIDDHRDGRSKPHKKRREFDFFGDD